MPRYRPIRGETDVEAPALQAEAHASPLSRAPALALSCREADNLGEADPNTYQPNPVGLSGPSSVLAPASICPMIDIGRCPWCGSQHPARNSALSTR